MIDPARENDDRTAIDLMIKGFQISRMLRLVADIRVADNVPPEGRVSVQELAATCSVLPAPLTRVLRALAAFQVFSIDIEGRVAHTPRSLFLRTDSPGSRHHMARFWPRTGSWLAWEKLDAALKGETPWEAAWGMGSFEYLREHSDEARLFDAAMAQGSDDRHRALAKAYDFSAVRRIADIGGGNGASLRAVLEKYPNVNGLLFDQQHVLAALTPEHLLDGRIATQAGDFFTQVPEGADTYLLSRVLHDWDDDDVVRILQVCNSAMSNGATLLILEQLLDPEPGRSDPAGYLTDTQMMVAFGGARERSEGEFAVLLEQAGFTINRVWPTHSRVSVIEAGLR